MTRRRGRSFEGCLRHRTGNRRPVGRDSGGSPAIGRRRVGAAVQSGRLNRPEAPQHPPRTRVTVWDLPTRLFHWGLVAAVTTAWVAQWTGQLTLHMYAGYTAATLVVFRLIWGLIGSETARFGQFIRGPATVMRYLRTGSRDRLGHNPVGALSVLLLMLLVLAQAATGLFSNDDIFFDGPWARVLTKDTSDAVTGYHGLNKNVLIALIALHLGAVAWYRRKGEDLTRPMLTGRKAVPAGTPEPRRRPLWLAALVLALSAGLVGIGFRFWLL